MNKDIAGWQRTTIVIYSMFLAAEQHNTFLIATDNLQCVFELNFTTPYNSIWEMSPSQKHGSVVILARRISPQYSISIKKVS